MRKVCPIRKQKKNGGATRRRFFAVREKPQGEGVAPPPLYRRGLIHTLQCIYWTLAVIQFRRCCSLTRARLGSEPPSHGRGGRMTAPPPQRTRKLRKIATSGKRRWIGRGKFYNKKNSDHFLISSNLRSQGVKKGIFFLNQAFFTENRNYLNNYTK